jgi:GntR family transcriptional regulator
MSVEDRDPGQPKDGGAAPGIATPVVSGRTPLPLYHQVFLIMRDRILDGMYPPGGLLPSEQEIMRAFDVSRITAKRAMDELAAVGMVRRERGRGTIVTYKAPPRLETGIEGLLENLLAMGLETDVDLKEFGYVPAGNEIARALGLQPGEMVQCAVRVRSLEGKPFSHLTTYVPEAIGMQYGRDDLASKPLLMLLERCGVSVGGAEQTISATLADPAVARALETETGSPLIRIARIVRDESGRGVEYLIGYYRPDRYQYRMALHRVQDRGRTTWSTGDWLEPRPTNAAGQNQALKAGSTGRNRT